MSDDYTPPTELERLTLKRDSVRSQLIANERQHVALCRQIAELQKEAKELLYREGGLYAVETGLIVRQRQQLKKLDLLIEDEQKPVVYWSRYNGDNYLEPTTTPTSYGHTHTPYVVDKVTKKRFYVRKKGEDSQLQFQHDGTPVSGYQRNKIDIALTFPNGLKPS